MIEVAALTSGRRVPSARFRVRQHVEPLRSLGVDVHEYVPAIDKYARLPGWPAGVSLAALWLAGLDAPSDGIQQFSADHRHVADYLTSEVLDPCAEKLLC